jgi:NADPH:quinone reductase-like Zn-dependent oxidoreductase
MDGDEAIHLALASALRALADGKLDVAVDSAIPLSRVNEAFERLAGRKAKGKLVLDLRA